MCLVFNLTNRGKDARLLQFLVKINNKITPIEKQAFQR